MNPVLIAALISGIVSLIGGGLSAYSNKRTREYNKELAEYQNQESLAQWARENEYNSPLAQMSRFGQAGLNPQLIYGQQNLSASSPLLTSGQSGSPLDFSPFSASIADSVGQLPQQLAEVDLMNSQTEYYRSLTEDKGKDIEFKAIQIDLAKATFGSNVEKAQKDVDLLNSQIDEIGSRVKNMDVDTYIMQVEAHYADEKAQKELKEISARIRNLISDSVYKDSLKELTEVQCARLIEMFPYEIANMSADTKLKCAEYAKVPYEMTDLFYSACRKAFDLQYDKDNKYFFEYTRIMSDVFHTPIFNLPGQKSRSNPKAPKAPRPRVR